MAGTYTFSIPDSDSALMENFQRVSRREGRKTSNVIVDLLKEYCKQHDDAHNPQTLIDDFEKPYSAVPNLYSPNDELVKKFYDRLESKAEYEKIDQGLNTFMQYHNKKYHDMLRAHKW